MKYTHLPTTDIQVSRICLGTMTWGNQNSETDAHAQMDYALAHGVNFWDTAELYAVPMSAETQGLTERYIGTWFAQHGGRDKIVLASKIAGAGMPWIRGGRGIDGAGIRAALEGSLTRLQTDHIDLYQLHWPNRGHYHFRQNWDYAPWTQDSAKVEANWRDILETLDALVKEGKIRHVGLSNESAWGTMTALERARSHSLPRMVTVQNEYNLLCRTFDLDMAEVAHHENVGLLAYSPLADGMLSGKYSGNVVPAGSRGELIKDLWGRITPTSLEAADAYVALAREHGLDPCQMAIAFTLSRPFVTSTIIGATSMDQLASNTGAVDLTLSQEVMDGIARLHQTYPMPY